MIYGSVCSGIEAATVAWHPLGWRPAFFSEIDRFPRAVLAHHYPDVPCHGDFTTISGDDYGPIDLLVGGTPCQAFSVAGLRKGFADERGNLTLEYVRLAQRKQPRWLLWENVPGVLSLDKGRAFGAFLGGLAECGYGFAYRVLDAQYFRVAQRRSRVFVVGYLGDWRPAAAVLFERESLQGHSAPRREAGQGAARGFEVGPSGGGFTDLAPTLDCRAKNGPIQNQIGAGVIQWPADCAPTLNAAFGKKLGLENQHVNQGCPLFVPSSQYGDIAGTLTAAHDSSPGGGGGRNIIAFSAKDYGADACKDMSPTLRAGAHDKSHANSGNWMAVATHSAVRRLTPTECERLQGFPDGYTLISPKTADGPRYKALGNSMAVPVMRWLGERIAMVEALRCS
jgi:DNA (cytosine-5)-methyltransferase 1